MDSEQTLCWAFRQGSQIYDVSKNGKAGEPVAQIDTDT
jgi:hypothetical protein